MKTVAFLISRIVLFFLFQLHTVTISEVSAVTHEVNDLTVTRAVERALEKDKYISAHLIDVHTKNGLVTLSGTVGNILEKDRATEITMSVTGVYRIHNNIVVTSVDRTDAQIQKT